MCGRFVLHSDTKAIQLALPVDRVETKVVPNYNIAPTTPVAIVVQHDGENTLVSMRWGIIPPWSDGKVNLFNVRADSVATKPYFTSILKRRRGLIPADGWFEWQKGKVKRPMYFRLNSDEPLALAGIFSDSKLPTGEMVTCCSIITTDPNSLAKPVHNRMPVVLPKSAYAVWLDPSNQNVDELVSLLNPFPSGELKVYEVSPLVNSVKVNSPDCIRPLA